MHRRSMVERSKYFAIHLSFFLFSRSPSSPPFLPFDSISNWIEMKHVIFSNDIDSIRHCWKNIEFWNWIWRQKKIKEKHKNKLVNWKRDEKRMALKTFISPPSPFFFHNNSRLFYYNTIEALYFFLVHSSRKVLSINWTKQKMKRKKRECEKSYLCCMCEERRIKEQNQSTFGTIVYVCMLFQ